MNDVLDNIRVRVGAEHLGQSVQGEGCRAFMTGVSPDRVIVNTESAFPAHGLEGERAITFLSWQILKQTSSPRRWNSKAVKSTQRQTKLQGGATFIERGTPATSATVRRPILFHGRSIHPKERKALNRRKSTYCGRRGKTARCNRPRNLADALQNVMP